jgi:hypothetical protein
MLKGFASLPSKYCSVLPKEARVRFRVRVPVPVRYDGTTILKKIGYGYGGIYVLLKKFIYYYAYIFHILISICEFKSNYG